MENELVKSEEEALQIFVGQRIVRISRKDIMSFELEAEGGRILSILRPGGLFLEIEGGEGGDAD